MTTEFDCNAVATVACSLAFMSAELLIDLVGQCSQEAAKLAQQHALSVDIVVRQAVIRWLVLTSSGWLCP